MYQRASLASEVCVMHAVFSVRILLDDANKLTKSLRHIQCKWLQQSSQEMDNGVQGHGLCCWSVEAFVRRQTGIIGNRC